MGSIEKENMNIVIVGHVDHGKSTIIGRLLADCGSLPTGKLEQVKEQCKRNAKPFEYAFLLDALKDEQAQGITIDAARCFFRTQKRNYTIIDAPGHKEFIKNMITGASRAEAALLVIDAEEGVQENTRRHGYLLSLLGIRQAAVLINKMDLVGYSEKVFWSLVNNYSEFLDKVNVKPSFFIPVSGISGDNIASGSRNMGWHNGKTVLQALDEFKAEELPVSKPFRMPVQGVYKFTNSGDCRRIIAGTVETGCMQVGDKVVFYPSGKESVVKTIESFNRDRQDYVHAGQAAGFTLNEQIYVRRGEVAAVSKQRPPETANRISVSLFWLGREPMSKGKEYILKIGTSKVHARLEEIIRITDASSLEEKTSEQIAKHEVAECSLKLDRLIAFDPVSDIVQTSRFAIVDDYELSGGGIIHKSLAETENGHSPDVTWQEGMVAYEERCRLLGQKGLIIWFTGLSGAGKSTIAIELERELVRRGRLAYRLDGDNIRYGLNSDLKFSEKERNENIRRIAEVAALFKDAGIITLVSFISPFKEMRDFARSRVKDGLFFEVYVKAGLAACIERDVKGLYKKALNGEISDFTGITSPYEEPDNPDITIDTEKLTVEQSIEKLLDIILEVQ